MIDVSFALTFCTHKDLGLADLSDILNVFLKSTEKFSRSLSKKFHPKKGGFVRIFQTDFELHLSKSQHFSLFLRYNLIGVSFGHDLFTDVKI